MPKIIMETFQRHLDDILKDLKSIDDDVRRIAIQDLSISDHPEKIALLNDLLKVEPNIQLKYEIRKSINEISSLSSLASISTNTIDDKRFANLKRCFLSKDLGVLNKAFTFASDQCLDEFLPEMLMIENYTRDSFQRCSIVKLMGKKKNTYFRSIIDYLSDSEPRVISTALEVLESINNTSALATITQFIDHSHNRVRATAIKALHNLGGKGAGALFLKMLQSPHSAYRDSAAYALCQIEVPEGVKLLSILLLDEVESIRKKALDGLQYLMEKGNTDAGRIIERLRNDGPYGLWPDKLVEKMAQPLKEKDVVNENRPVGSIDIAALYSDTSELRLSAIQKLAEEQGEQDNVRVIVERLKLEKDSKVIASALLALGRAKGDVSLKRSVLESFLTHSDERVRANAVESLTAVTEPRDRGFMFRCLDDKYNRVVGNAIVALWETLNKRSTKALDRLAVSTDPQAQLTAVYCIGELSDWKLAEISEKLLKSKHDMVISKMEETLEQLQDLPSFARALKNHKVKKGSSFEPRDH